MRVAVGASIGAFTAYIDAGTDSSTCGRIVEQGIRFKS